jgi:hypothetical protein
MEYLKYQLEGKDRETQTIKEFNWGQGDYHLCTANLSRMAAALSRIFK